MKQTNAAAPTRTTSVDLGERITQIVGREGWEQGEATPSKRIVPSHVPILFRLFPEPL
jgi:hypothetical protein